MPVSDYQMVEAWKQVLTLSRLEAGQTVTILTSAATHPQTLSTALIATQSMGAIVNRLDLPPVNGEKALSRDSLAYLGTTPLTGNPAAIAALKASDLVLDLMTLLFSPEQLDILKTGTRILLAVEPPEVLTRLVPSLADRERVLAALPTLTGPKRCTSCRPPERTSTVQSANSRRSRNTASSTSRAGGTTGPVALH